METDFDNHVDLYCFVRYTIPIEQRFDFYKPVVSLIERQVKDTVKVFERGRMIDKEITKTIYKEIKIDVAEAQRELVENIISKI